MDWFVLENEEAKSFRGIWCLPPRADRPEKVKDSTFTIQIKGMGMNKCASGYVQQKLFSAAEDAVYTLASRAEGRVDAVSMVYEESVNGSASTGGVSLSEAFAQWSKNQSNTGNDKGYWSEIETYLTENSEAEFSHGICHDCAKQFYPEMDLYGDD